jgi:hypothetical protein
MSKGCCEKATTPLHNNDMSAAAARPTRTPSWRSATMRKPDEHDVAAAAAEVAAAVDRLAAERGRGRRAARPFEDDCCSNGWKKQTTARVEEGGPSWQAAGTPHGPAVTNPTTAIIEERSSIDGTDEARPTMRAQGERHFFFCASRMISFASVHNLSPPATAKRRCRASLTTRERQTQVLHQSLALHITHR